MIYPSIGGERNKCRAYSSIQTISPSGFKEVPGLTSSLNRYHYFEWILSFLIVLIVRLSDPIDTGGGEGVTIPKEKFPTATGTPTAQDPKNQIQTC